MGRLSSDVGISNPSSSNHPDAPVSDSPQTKNSDIEHGASQLHHGIDTRAIHVGSDYIYEKKVSIMNQALIDIGMGPFQWKVFAMTGFGWFVDNVRTSSPMFS